VEIFHAALKKGSYTCFLVRAPAACVPSGSRLDGRGFHFAASLALKTCSARAWMTNRQCFQVSTQIPLHQTPQPTLNPHPPNP